MHYQCGVNSLPNTDHFVTRLVKIDHCCCHLTSNFIDGVRYFYLIEYI